MKVTSVTNIFLQFDALHKRVDLHRLLAHLIALAAVAGWAARDFTDTTDLLLRGLYALIFVMLFRLLLSRMGASRLAAMFLTVAALGLCSTFVAAELAVVCLYVLVLFLVQEYFMIRTKFVAVSAAIMVGALAVGADDHAPILLLLFVSSLLLRTLWHAVVERLGKKQFVLFGVKAVGMSVLATGIYLAVSSFVSAPANLPALPLPYVPLWLAIVLAVLTFRGAWATILLKTDRSPMQRGLRMFYVVYGFGLLLVVMFLKAYGDNIFVQNTLDKLAALGLTEYSITIGSFALLAVGLLVSAGIDRSLYKDTKFARLIQRQFRS